MNREDQVYKLCLIGAGGVGKRGVGKTTLVHGLQHYGAFRQIESPTVGPAVTNIKFPITQSDQHQSITFQIWERNCREKIQQPYYRLADCVVVMFDLHDDDSFEDIRWWLDEFRRDIRNEKLPGVLVGNKYVEGIEDITDRMIQRVSDRYFRPRQQFFKTNAMEGFNILAPFQFLARKLLNEEGLKLELSPQADIQDLLSRSDPSRSRPAASKDDWIELLLWYGESVSCLWQILKANVGADNGCLFPQPADATHVNNTGPAAAALNSDDRSATDDDSTERSGEHREMQRLEQQSEQELAHKSNDN